MRRGLLVLRSLLALLAGAGFLVLVILLAAVLWFDGFPVTGWGVAGLLLVELIAGLGGVAVVAWLAPGAPTAHGWLFGGLVFFVNVLTIFEPDTIWPLIPGLLLLAFVPLQTWIGVTVGIRLRMSKDPSRGRRVNAGGRSTVG